MTERAKQLLKKWDADGIPSPTSIKRSPLFGVVLAALKSSQALLHRGFVRLCSVVRKGSL